jgi:hypothetical protein
MHAQSCIAECRYTIDHQRHGAYVTHLQYNPSESLRHAFYVLKTQQSPRLPSYSADTAPIDSKPCRSKTVPPALQINNRSRSPIAVRRSSSSKLIFYLHRDTTLSLPRHLFICAFRRMRRSSPWIISNNPRHLLPRNQIETSHYRG